MKRKQILITGGCILASLLFLPGSMTALRAEEAEEVLDPMDPVAYGLSCANVKEVEVDKGAIYVSIDCGGTSDSKGCKGKTPSCNAYKKSSTAKKDIYGCKCGPEQKKPESTSDADSALLE